MFPKSLWTVSLLAAAGLSSGCGSKAPVAAKETAVPVRVRKPASVDRHTAIRAGGTVEARDLEGRVEAGAVGSLAGDLGVEELGGLDRICAADDARGPETVQHVIDGGDPMRRRRAARTLHREE